MKCSNCKKFYDDSFDFCPYCGTSKPEILTCPKCGFESHDFKFCPKCGEKLLKSHELTEYRINEEEERRKEVALKIEAEERRRKEEEKVKENENKKKMLLNIVSTSSLSYEEKSYLKKEIEKDLIKDESTLRRLINDKNELGEWMWDDERDEMIGYVYDSQFPGLLETYLCKRIEARDYENLNELKRAIPIIERDYYSGDLMDLY